MDALQIFQKLIGARIPPVVFKWPQYTKNFLTYPYHHSTTPTFENEFVDLNFDSIVFYAYEKEEIEKEYNRGRFSTLSDAARNAYERRVPKTERVTDGLVGELTLDSFIKCFFNIIINRLDEIGGFLERIKNNQYIPVRSRTRFSMLLTLSGEMGPPLGEGNKYWSFVLAFCCFRTSACRWCDRDLQYSVPPTVRPCACGCCPHRLLVSLALLSPW